MVQCIVEKQMVNSRKDVVLGPKRERVQLWQYYDYRLGFLLRRYLIV